MAAINFLLPVDAAPTAASGSSHRWLERLLPGLVAPAGRTKDNNVNMANYATDCATLDELDCGPEQRRHLLGGAQPGAAVALTISQWMQTGISASLDKMAPPFDFPDAGFSIGRSWRKPV